LIGKHLSLVNTECVKQHYKQSIVVSIKSAGIRIGNV